MAGTDTTRPMLAEGPAIVLVEPQLAENIGMAARAMANFGLADLRLVAPRDGWPHPKAQAAASGATHVIDNVRVFDTLAEALADCRHVAATTARHREGFKRVLGPDEAVGFIRANYPKGEGAAILFGRERFGLSNEEVGLADEIVTFPVNPGFASLNIAQAVLLVSYEWMKSGLGAENRTPFAGPQFTPAPKEELYGLFEHLEGALAARGYFRPPEKTAVMKNNLREVLTRPGFNTPEIRLLRGAITSLDVFSPDLPRGAGTPPGRRKPAGGKRRKKGDTGEGGDA